MTRNEVVEALAFLNNKKDGVLSRFSKQQKENMIQEWLNVLSVCRYDHVIDAIEKFISKSGYIPYANEILNIVNEQLDENAKSLWYRFFPEEGDFYYTDKQMKEASDYVKEATNDKEWRIPDEMRKRMHYRRDPDDTDMNYLVNEIQSIQMLGFENEDAKQRLNKLIEMYTS